MAPFSLINLKVQHSRWILRSHGLQSVLVKLPNGCSIHCWAPATSDGEPADRAPPPPPAKPVLLFLHGFGANGTIAWDSQVPAFSKKFALFLPDLLFFGDSTAGGDGERLSASAADHGEDQKSERKHSTPDKVRYSEIFQAECLYQALRKLGVQNAVVVGHSYGGFVAYSMAHLYPSFVRKLVIVSSGIMMDSHTNDRLLQQFGASCIHDILVPQTLANFTKSLQFTFNGYIPSWLPSCIFKGMYEALSGERDKRSQLVDDIILDKEDAPALPTIDQSTLIVWGDKDQIFDISLAYKLKEFLGSKAELQIISGASHVPLLLNSHDVNKLLLSFV